ncbi:MAG TPA: GNAT family N-acetyltransferase [Thermoplasmata archaeon]|nr:GNAT family N-acetyltransferase [Thermoplasmata archaeon]
MAREARRIRIRGARLSDVAPILACLRDAFAPYRRRYTAVAFSATVLDARRLARRLRVQHVLVATDTHSRILGTVSVRLSAASHARLRGMAVPRERQGTGVANRLLRAALRFAHRRGCHRVTLETTPPLRRAMRFYERQGFRRTGRYRNWGGMRLIEYAASLPEAAALADVPRRRDVRRKKLGRRTGRRGSTPASSMSPRPGRPTPSGPVKARS